MSKESSSQPNLPQIPKLEKPARPWDMLNPSIGRVSEEVKAERLAICATCPFFFKVSKQCRKCGCHMPWKTGLPHATCPEGHWGTAEDIEKNN